MRTAARRDANEKAIIDALEGVGATVARISDSGLPDLMIYYEDRIYLMEVKSKRGKLTPAQKSFIASWPGQVHVIHTIKESLNAIGCQSN